MITIDKSKLKHSNATLHDKDGNVIGIAKNISLTKDDDLCKGHRLTNTEYLSLFNFCGFSMELKFEPLELEDRKEV